MDNPTQELKEMRERIEKLEMQMLYLFRNLGITAQESPIGQASPKVIELLEKGDRNGAIRAYKEETGASLKDAKLFIEKLQ